MRHFEEDKKAVSPVIAVILMVAITVVLAGLLYVWINSFSTGSEGEVVYVGYDVKETLLGWEVSIINVQGQSIPLDIVSLLIYDQNKVLFHQYALSDTKPGPFAIQYSTIYPIPMNSSGVISKLTMKPILANDSLSNYVGAIFAYKDFNNDKYVSSGDTITIFSDFNGDGKKDIMLNYYFSMKDIPKTHKYIWAIL
ncbi:archaellin/type IV pilin N-terminal domain-containing protein [[Eubacterium] cellulosolvens]